MIKFKRQGGGTSSSAPASAPTSLAYGEPAVSSDGTIYMGDGSGKVVSKVENSEKSASSDHAAKSDNATKADHATNADNSKKSDDALNGLWEFTGTFMLDAWVEGEGTFTQTVTVTPAYGSKTMTSSARLSHPLTSQTDNFETNETKLAALAIINKGNAVPGENTVTVTCNEKPECDLDVHWYVKI